MLVALHYVDRRSCVGYIYSGYLMEELLTGLGGGSVGIGAIVWYAKARFMKFDQKISSMKKEIVTATKDNHLQEEQIKTMQKDIDYLKRRLDNL